MFILGEGGGEGRVGGELSFSSDVNLYPFESFLVGGGTSRERKGSSFVRQPSSASFSLPSLCHRNFLLHPKNSWSLTQSPQPPHPPPGGGGTGTIKNDKNEGSIIYFGPNISFFLSRDGGVGGDD